MGIGLPPASGGILIEMNAERKQVVSVEPGVRSATLRLADALKDLLSPGQVLTRPEEFATYARFFWLPPRPRVAILHPLGPPAAIVRPRTAHDVAIVLRHAAEAAVPVVPYGGGTGVMGGATPIEGGLVLDLGAMSRILAINASDRTAEVEPGVILSDLASAAEEKGLLFAHDPWSQPIATVGGAVGTNGVGYLAAGYGVMGDQVRALEVVLPTGEVVSWAPAVKAPGPPLWKLFVGAEGTLGVVTRVTVELFPCPETRLFSAFRFPRFADGVRAILEIGAAGLRPVMIDYEEVDRPPLAAPADLYLAFDGPSTVVRAARRLAQQICQANQGRDRGTRAARHFWEHRHDTAYGFLRRTSFASPPGQPGWVYLNVAVPRGQVLDYLSQVVEIAARHGVVVESFGIWARPELVSFILSGPRGDPGPGPLEQAADEVMLLARQLGGSIEYCHGAGLRLAHLMRPELANAFDLLGRLKERLDPGCILNPGKLGLCAASTTSLSGRASSTTGSRSTARPSSEVATS